MSTNRQVKLHDKNDIILLNDTENIKHIQAICLNTSFDNIPYSDIDK